MEEWYEVAFIQLDSILASEDKVSGLEFMEDFVLEHRDRYFEKLEFDEIDHFVSEEFESFQGWLKSFKSDSVTIGINGKWYNHTAGYRDPSKFNLTPTLTLTAQEESLLELNALSLNPGRIEDFRSLSIKLSSTNFHEIKFKCAYRLAKCAELSRDIHENEIIDFWRDASDMAQRASMVKEACDSKSKAAYHYQRISDHKKAAVLYKEAFDLVKDIEYPEKMQLLRNSRMQYQLICDHVSASGIFKEEKDLEIKDANKSKKVVIWLYWLTSDYGESPKRVIYNSIIVIVIATILSLVLGITVSESEDCITWSALADSAYYSVVTFTTLGYGDIYPLSYSGKLLASFIAILGLIYTSLFMVTVVRKYSRS